jgi:class 3 adenylate cyclase
MMVHDRPFYREGTFHALVGAILIGSGLVLYRTLRLRLRRRAGPAGFVSEAVLAADLVDSTRLATHYGEAVALHARNALNHHMQRLTYGARSFLETTGDGCLVTFPRVALALDAARALVREFRERPSDVGVDVRLEVRVGVTYGEILLDARGIRHGAAINKAHRLLGVQPTDFVELKDDVEGGGLPPRTRILLDEDAVQEVGRTPESRFVGYARLKGFTGLHGLYEVTWQAPTTQIAGAPSGGESAAGHGGTP